MSEIFKPAAEFPAPLFDAVGDIDLARSHCEEWQLRQLSPEQVVDWWHTYNEQLDAVPVVLWNTRPSLVYRFVYAQYAK